MYIFLILLLFLSGCKLSDDFSFWSAKLKQKYSIYENRFKILVNEINCKKE